MGGFEPPTLGLTREVSLFYGTCCIFFIFPQPFKERFIRFRVQSNELSPQFFCVVGNFFVFFLIFSKSSTQADRWRWSKPWKAYSSSFFFFSRAYSSFAFSNCILKLSFPASAPMTDAASMAEASMSLL